jgi:splicing factor 3A subunit 1
MTTMEEEDESIIYPPPELKEVADKTAGAVAKNGPGFEDRLREKELHNPRFCFLNPNDPFHKYYQKKVRDIKAGVEEKKVTPAQRREAEQVQAIPLPPPAFEYFIDLPSISKQDLEIVKLTAQFVAKNGTQFMNALSQREDKNSQFDFLRPSHSFYNYFMSLVGQYTKILSPPAHLSKYLEINVTDRYLVLDRITKRLEFEAYVASEKERVQQEVDEERMAFATIDWHDFTVVETIEFTDADKKAVLPPPTILSELKSMTLEQRKQLVTFEQPDIGMGEEDMEVILFHVD